MTITSDKPAIRSGDSLKVTISLKNETDSSFSDVKVAVPWDVTPPSTTYMMTSGTTFSNAVWRLSLLPAHTTATFTLVYSQLNFAKDSLLKFEASVDSLNGGKPNPAIKKAGFVRVNACYEETVPSVILDRSDTASSYLLSLNVASSHPPSFLSGFLIGASNTDTVTNIPILGGGINLYTSPVSIKGKGIGMYDLKFLTIHDASACGETPICYSKKLLVVDLAPQYPDTIPSSNVGFLCSGSLFDTSGVFTTIQNDFHGAVVSFKWWISSVDPSVQINGTSASVPTAPTTKANALPSTALLDYSVVNTGTIPAEISLEIEASCSYPASPANAVTKTYVLKRYVAPTLTAQLNLSSHIDRCSVPTGAGSFTVQTEGGWGGNTYSWNTNPPQILTVDSIGNLPDGMYTVVVTDQKGCVAIDSGRIYSMPLTVTVDSISQILCNGGTDGGAAISVFGGVEPYSFVWDNGSVDKNLTGVSSGTYSLTVTDSVGCITSAQVVITEPLPIAIDVTLSSLTCAEGNDASISLAVTGGATPYTYSWVNSSSDSASAVGLGAGAYAVTITDANGCQITMDTLVPNVERQVVSIGNEQDSICLGASDTIRFAVQGTLRAPYTVHYRVHGATETISDNQTLSAGELFVVVTPTTVGDFSYDIDRVEDTFGCQLEVVGSRSLFVKPIIVSDSTKLIVRIGENVNHQIIVQNGHTNNYSFKEIAGGLPGGLTLSSSGQLTGYVNDAVGVYVSQVEVSELSSCSNLHIVQIEVESEDSKLVADFDTICAGDPVSLTVQTQQQGTTFRWRSSNGLDTITANSTLRVLPTASRTYTVDILDANNVVRGTATMTIYVYPRPHISMSTNAPKTGKVHLGESITTTVFPSTYPYYQFSFNGDVVPGTTESIFSTSAWLVDKRNIVAVTVKSVDGCVESGMIEFTGPQYDLPNLITPNGDGLNDRLLSGFEINVFNRWGAHLYEGKDGWDGTFRGEQVPEGTYYYTVRVISPDGSIIDLKHYVLVKY